MTFTFGWALAILVVMYYVSSVLSTKTRARIGTMIFFSVFILIGYWTIFPADIIATSQIPVVAAITNLVLLINVGSSFDLATLKQDWRVVVVTLVGCLGMGVPEVCPIAQGQLFVYMDVGILFVLIVPEFFQDFAAGLTRETDDIFLSSVCVSVHELSAPHAVFQFPDAALSVGSLSCHGMYLRR